MSALGQKRTFALQKVMSALPPKADIGGNLSAEGLILGCSRSRSTSNKIIQKGLASSRR